MRYFKICSRCHQEFEISDWIEDGSHIIFSLVKCSHCKKDDRVFIRIELQEGDDK